MASIATLPSDDSPDTFTLVRWLKSDGEFVSEGELIAEIETTKASVEVEAWASGILWQIAKPGDQLTLETVDDVFARIEPKSSD